MIGSSSRDRPRSASDACLVGVGDGERQQVVAGLVRHRRTPPRPSPRIAIVWRGAAAPARPSRSIQAHRGDRSWTTSSTDGPDGDPARGKDPQSEERDRLQEAILREQVAYLIKAMGGPDVRRRRLVRGRPWLDYLYRPGYVLARDEHWRDVAELARAPSAGRRRAVAAPARPDRPAGDRPTTPRRFPTSWRGSTASSGVGKATPDHIMFVTPGGGGTAVPGRSSRRSRARTPAPYPAITSDLGAGTEVFVSVVDTGWWPPCGTDPATAVARRAWTATPRRSTSTTSTRTPGTARSSPASSAPRPRRRRSAWRASCRLGGAAYESDMVVQLGEALEH